MTTPTDERRPDPADLPVLRRRPTTGTTPHAALLGLVPQLPDPSDHSPMLETVPDTVDYRQVIVLRRRVSEELNRRVDDQVNRAAAQRGLDPRRDRELLELSAEEEQELTREVILEVIDAADADSTNRGDGAFPLPYRQVLAKTLYDAIHGLGPLQPLLDDPTIQNIVIASGYDRMFIYRDDGSIEKIPPVFASNEDLLAYLASLAAKGQGGNARPFSPAVPELHVRLQDGSRLAAVNWVSPAPSVVIRCHRLKTATIEGLVERDMMTPVLGSFLAAGMKARLNFIISGDQGAGKTTLARGMCSVIPPWESIGVIETNAELFLDEFPDRHWIVHAWEERKGMGEIGADGIEAGSYSLARALETSQRFQLVRTIVGEVRGPEIWTLIKSMESGGGGLCTTHSLTASRTIDKLVTCAMEAGSHITAELAYMKLAQVIDVVVHIGVERIPTGDGRWRLEHWVDEVLHVTRGEDATTRISMTPIFKTLPGTRVAVPHTLPDDLRFLADYGFDIDTFTLSTLEES